MNSVLVFLACSNVPIEPEKPVCEESEELFFVDAFDGITRGRTQDDGYHSDGPKVAILDIERDGVWEIFQCYPNEPTFIYSLSGRKQFSDSCGFMLVADIDQDGWDDLVIEADASYFSDRRELQFWNNQQGHLERVGQHHRRDAYQRGSIHVEPGG